MSSSQPSERIDDLMNAAVRNIAEGNIDDAIDDLRSAEILDATNPLVLYNLAVAYARDGLYRTAVEYADKLVSLPSAFVDIKKVRRLKGYSLAMLNRYGEAEEALGEILTVSADDVHTLSMLAYVCEKQGKNKDAIDYYRKILVIDRGNLTALNSLAYIMGKTGGDLNGALQLAKKAVESDPDNPAYLDTLGFIHMKRKETDMAKKHLKKAFEKLPHNEEIKQHLNELLKL